jgi:hypothetical protein
MRPAAVVVTELLPKDPAPVSLIEHDDVIQTIPTYGTDNAFDKWILPRRARRCRYLLDTQALDPSLHSVTIDEIKVMQQMTVRD